MVDGAILEQIAQSIIIKGHEWLLLWWLGNGGKEVIKGAAKTQKAKNDGYEAL